MIPKRLLIALLALFAPAIAEAQFSPPAMLSAAVTPPASPFQGITWGHRPITWGWATPASATAQGLGTVTNEITNAAQKAAVRAGINDWAALSGVILSELAAPTGADVQVGYASLGGLLGQANWNYNSGTNKYNFTLIQLQDPAGSAIAADGSGNLAYSCCTAWLRQVAEHEMGVLFGLNEITRATSILNHTQGTLNRFPDAGDVSATHTLFGPPLVCTKQFYDDFSGGYATNWNVQFPWDAGTTIYDTTYVHSDPSVTPDMNPFSTGTFGLKIGAQLTNGVADANGLTWFTGMLTSKFTQIFGYFEFKSAMPLSAGAVMGINWLYPTGASGDAELDLIQHFGNTVDQTVHLPNGTPGGNLTQSLTLGDVTAFHTFGVDWQTGTTTFYVDNIQTFQVTTPSNSKAVPMQMVLSLSIGNGTDLPTPTTEGTVIPQFMTVQYAGVWANKAARDACTP